MSRPDAHPSQSPESGTPRSRPRIGLRRSVFLNVLLFSLLISSVLITVVVVNSQRSVEELSRSIINGATDRVSTELLRFFDPILDQLTIARSWGETGVLEAEELEELNRRFRPILDQIPQLSSILIGNEQGREYLLLKTTNGWLNRLSDPQKWGKRVRWLEWDAQGNRLSESWEESDYDTRTRPWFEGADRAAPGQVYWTDPYLFLTTRDPGMTAAMNWTDSSGLMHVLALDVLLEDLSLLTATIPVGDNGQVVVMSEDTRVLGLPADERFSDPDWREATRFRRARNLDLPRLPEAVERWQERGMPASDPQRFRGDEGPVWSGFRPFRLGMEKRLWIGVVVPGSDLLGEARRQNWLLASTVGGSVAVALVFGFVLERRLRRQVGEEVARARRMGQYTLEEKLGQGGVGAVYRARHALLRRPTAVKLLRPGQADDEQALLRFEREVQITSGLTHPNTVAIYDYGRTPDGVFYYAMEDCGEFNLEKLVEEYGPVSPERTVYLLRQVCGSLAEAHKIGLIHRDIKPANIMLCERGGLRDFVKVVDFGMVKATGADRLDLTAADVALGTPHFMAPESLKADATIDPRADLYALGAVAYYMLLGRHVFDGLSAVEIARQQLNEEPPPLGRSYGPGLPEDLERIVMQLLAKDPDQRPASAEVLGKMLRKCSCAGEWNQQRAAQWWAEAEAQAPEGEQAGVSGDEAAATTVLTVDMVKRP